jgi:hypothetical protein
VRNRLLIDYVPRFRGSGYERRRLHRIDAAKHMSRFYQLDVQQDLDDRRQFDRRTSRADVPERHLLTSLSITFAPFIKSIIRSRTQTRAPSGTAA